MSTRREFLALARAAGGAALARGLLCAAALARASRARAALDSPGGLDAPAAAVPAAQREMLNPLTLERFVDAMPIPPIAVGEGMRTSPLNRRIRLPYYRIELRELETRLHRDLPPTRQWAYAQTVPGPTFETRSGQGLFVEWANCLPRQHFLPVDHTLHGAGADRPEVRTVTHVHGAKAPPESDGYPESWLIPGESRVLHYPNEQEAATLWYHDHAMGITRLNIFAGLFGTFIIRDAAEEALGLPAGKYDIPLTLYDRTLDRQGQLLYPVSGTPGAPFVSEFYGNAIVCNGKLHPYLPVEPRQYRFRLLNASNGRFLHLSLSGSRLFHQVAADLGLLAAPVELRSVLLFPAERADVIIDFTGLDGEVLHLENDAEQVLEFRVQRPEQRPAAPARAGLPPVLRPVPRVPESEALRERFLTLSEHDDPAGRSMQMLLNESHWDAPVTEQPVLGTTEIWSFVNLTGDAHPVHLHLARFQVLDRRPFDLFAYRASGKLRYTGAALPPEANELGWKDTVRADPGVVTRIIARFEGYTGRYVWHCHMLEHEDNEMMRPYDVVAPRNGHKSAAQSRTGKPLERS